MAGLSKDDRAFICRFCLKKGGKKGEKLSHFIIRKVRNGHIKFDNQLWETQEPTERLNGMRFAFGVYVEGTYSHPVKRLDTLCLWGSEKAYKASGEDAYIAAYNEEIPILSPDGYLRQYWWHPINSIPTDCPKPGEGV